MAQVLTSRCHPVASLLSARTALRPLCCCSVRAIPGSVLGVTHGPLSMLAWCEEWQGGRMQKAR